MLAGYVYEEKNRKGIGTLRQLHDKIHLLPPSYDMDTGLCRRRKVQLDEQCKVLSFLNSAMPQGVRQQ